MSARNLVSPVNLKIDFAPSPRQYEVWKALQPECNLCGGTIENVYIGEDNNGNKKYVPECSSCHNRNIPQMVLGGGAAGGGKAQPYYSNVLTPDGWKEMGKIEIGDKVICKSGKIANVIAIHEQGIQPINRINFSDGTHTDCCDDHLWGVYEKKKDNELHTYTYNYRIIETSRMITNRRFYMKNYYVPPIEPVEFGKKYSEGVTIDSYVEMILLNDTINYIIQKRSFLQSIPDSIKNGSLADRKEFLNCLYKRDALEKSNGGEYVFYTRLEQIAQDTAYIIRSLGGYAKCKYIKTYKRYRVVFNFSVNSDILPRIENGAVFVRRVDKINEHFSKELCRCITIDDEEQLYITDDFIPTHNSYLGSCWVISSCIRFPGIRAVVARKTIKSLKESTLVTIKKVLKEWGLIEDENYCINNVENTITFWNDSIILLKEMVDLPSDLDFSRFGSMEVTIVFVDEVSEISEKAIDVMFSRIRWKTTDTFKVPKMFMSCNPSAGWLRDRFVQDTDGNPIRCRDGERFIRFSIFDNPDDNFRRTYESSLNKIKDNATRERLLYGNWDYTEANPMALYSGFTGDVNLVDGLCESIYDPMKPLILGFDFNVFPYMTCEVCQIDYDMKNVYFIKEFLGSPKDKLNNTPAFSKYVKECLMDMKHIGGTIITGDPAGRARSTQTEEGINNFTIIISNLENTILHPTLRLLQKQPSQKNRIEWINGMFQGKYGWNIYIDTRLRKLTEDLLYQAKNEDGTKEKKKVTDPDTKVKYEKYGHCFVAGTMVKTARGVVPIEEVTEMDYVLTRKGYKKVFWSGITNNNAEVAEYLINGKTKITCTPDHPFYTCDKGFIPIGSIVNKGKKVRLIKLNKPFMKLRYTLSHPWCSVSEVRRYHAPVYDLYVNDEHEFFANNILVHNCSDILDYLLCTMLTKDWREYQIGQNGGKIITTANINLPFSY